VAETLVSRPLLVRIAYWQKRIDTNDMKDRGWSQVVDEEARREIGVVHGEGFDLMLKELRELHSDLAAMAFETGPHLEQRRARAVVRIEELLAHVVGE
jgi:nitrate/nitrite-specific signal transduction histidine kinase